MKTLKKQKRLVLNFKINKVAIRYINKKARDCYQISFCEFKKTRKNHTNINKQIYFGSYIFNDRIKRLITIN